MLLGTFVAKMFGKALTGNGGAGMPETGKDPVPLVVGIGRGGGGGGGQLNTLGRHGTDV